MVNCCVCAGCSNSSLSGHRVHTFPRRESDGVGCFRAWVRFVRARRRDFTAASVTKNTVVCGAHFRGEDYVPGDVMAFRMGFRSQVRLMPGAVPSLHSGPSLAATAASPGGNTPRRTSTGPAGMCAGSSDHLGGGDLAQGASSSVGVGNGSWNHMGMDQITVVRIDDSHIADVQGKSGPEAGGESATGGSVEDEEEDGVYVIEYSNPEEEGESYQFKLALDRPAEKKNRPSGREHLRRPLAKKSRVQDAIMEMRWSSRKKAKSGNFHPSQSGVALDGWSQQAGQKKGTVVCELCPPPGKSFINMSGFSKHVSLLHNNGLRKVYPCQMCQQQCHSQFELDAHIRAHVNQSVVFKCPLCSFSAAGKIRKRGKKGRSGIRKHLEVEHPGIVPHCDVCDKDFKGLDSYLADQARHIGVTPFYCAKCKIYEITERGLLVHIRNKHPAERPGGQDSSATEDSDA